MFALPKNPLKVVKYKDKFPVDDWSLAFDMGYDSENDYKYAVCTNQVRGSELDDETVEEQAKKFAISNLLVNFVIDNFSKFNRDQQYTVKKILDLLETDELIDNGKGAKRVPYMSLFDNIEGDDE